MQRDPLASVNSYHRQRQHVNWCAWRMAHLEARPAWQVALREAVGYAGWIVLVMSLVFLEVR